MKNLNIIGMGLVGLVAIGILGKKVLGINKIDNKNEKSDEAKNKKEDKPVLTKEEKKALEKRIEDCKKKIHDRLENVEDKSSDEVFKVIAEEVISCGLVEDQVPNNIRKILSVPDFNESFIRQCTVNLMGNSVAMLKVPKNNRELYAMMKRIKLRDNMQEMIAQNNISVGNINYKIPIKKKEEQPKNTNNKKRGNTVEIIGMVTIDKDSNIVEPNPTKGTKGRKRNSKA